MAPVAARVYAPQEPNVIVCDMGGTSFDVSLVRDGYIKFTRETWLGAQFTGHMTGLSAVDIKNIGAGGGSIAWIDAGGLAARRSAERRRQARAPRATAPAAPSRRSRTRRSCSDISIRTTSSAAGCARRRTRRAT